MDTLRRAYISQVAGIIANWGTPPFGGASSTEELARTINGGMGWGFDFRSPVEEYSAETAWTRVRGLHLAQEDLERAIKLAQVWEA